MNTACLCLGGRVWVYGNIVFAVYYPYYMCSTILTDISEWVVSEEGEKPLEWFKGLDYLF